MLLSIVKMQFYNLEKTYAPVGLCLVDILIDKLDDLCSFGKS